MLSARPLLLEHPSGTDHVHVYGSDLTSDPGPDEKARTPRSDSGQPPPEPTNHPPQTLFYSLAHGLLRTGLSEKGP